MPKANRNRIGGRGQVEVNADAGSPNVPAAIRMSASAPGGGSYVAPTGTSGMSLALSSLSSAFRELAGEAQYQQRRAEKRADNEAERARIRAEQDAEAREEVAATRSGLEFRYKLGADILDGTVSQPEQFRARMDEFYAAAEGAQSSKTALTLMKLGVGMEEDFSKQLLEINEKKRISGLEASSTEFLRAVTEGAATMTADDVMMAIDSGLDAARRAGLDDAQHYQRAQTALLNSSLAMAGTEQGDALNADVEELFASGRLVPQTAEGLQNFYAYRTQYAALSRQRADAEEQRSINDETKRRLDMFNKVRGNLVHEPDVRKVMRTLAFYETDPGRETLQVSVGEENAAILVETARRQQEYLLNRDKPDRQEQDRVSRNIKQAIESSMRRSAGPLPDDSQIDAVAGLTPQDAESLKAARDGYIKDSIDNTRGMVEQYLEETEGKRRISRKKSDPLYNGNMTHSSAGIEALEFFTEAATQAYLGVDVKTPADEERRRNAVSGALDKASAYLLENMASSIEKKTIQPEWTAEEIESGYLRDPAALKEFEDQLFSSPDAVAVTRRGQAGNYSTGINRDLYSSLSPKMRQFANDRIRLRSVNEYIARYNEESNRTEVYRFSPLMMVPDLHPGYLDRDVGDAADRGPYDIDVSEVPSE